MSQDNEPKKPEPRPPERDRPVRESEPPGRKTFSEPKIEPHRIESDEPWPRPKK
jgi:hypothetical protein